MTSADVCAALGSSQRPWASLGPCVSSHQERRREESLEQGLELPSAEKLNGPGRELATHSASKPEIDLGPRGPGGQGEPSMGFGGPLGIQLPWSTRPAVHGKQGSPAQGSRRSRRPGRQHVCPRALTLQGLRSVSRAPRAGPGGDGAGGGGGGEVPSETPAPEASMSLRTQWVPCLFSAATDIAQMTTRCPLGILTCPLGTRVCPGPCVSHTAPCVTQAVVLGGSEVPVVEVSACVAQL